MLLVWYLHRLSSAIFITHVAWKSTSKLALISAQLVECFYLRNNINNNKESNNDKNIISSKGHTNNNKWKRRQQLRDCENCSPDAVQPLECISTTLSRLIRKDNQIREARTILDTWLAVSYCCSYCCGCRCTGADENENAQLSDLDSF